MSINPIQFREWVIKPALKAVDLLSDSAVNLLMLTAATESNMGQYIKQIGTSVIGGYGVYQIEIATYHDIWGRMVKDDIAMRSRIKLNYGYDGMPYNSRLVTDMALATIIARLIYRQYPEPLPKADDIVGLAAYWKKYYNTSKGDGTVDKAIADYRKYAQVT